MTRKKPIVPLALGPEDLADTYWRTLAPDELRTLISRHLDTHLPVIIEYAVASVVEPAVREFADKLRDSLIERLTKEREALIEDMIQEMRTKRKD